ncbi:MAG: ferredoxin reductase family protein [Acidobacteriota bacterium]|nr:ferredoxin reductase family protein [Acidobacteriota bacterium]
MAARTLTRKAAPSWTTATPASRRRAGHAPLPWVANLFVTVAAAGFVAAVALALTGESRAALAAPGGWPLALGRLFAFTGSYLMLVMVVLIARVPWLERTLGQDRLVRWHRTIGGWPVVLIALHIVSVTMGYAAMTKVGVVHQFWSFLVNYPDMLASLVGFGLLVTAGVSSYRRARQRMRYETWWVVHLYVYLALGLAFAHQIRTGVVFLAHPLARHAWIAVWLGAGALVVLSRVARPVVRNLRWRLRVADVVAETPDVYSLTLSGRGLSRLAVSGGQFFQWRFLTRGLWWHSHPYSLSALPRPPYLRLTVKALGDQSSALAHLKPGTRVFAEGPYGTFTHHARVRDSVVLVGAGVGITPLRALVEDLPRGVGVTAIVRASTPEDLVHRDEVAGLVAQRRGAFHELVGSREDVELSAATLDGLAPGIAASDLYVCGPAGFADHVVAAATSLGVPAEQIHHEAFTF